METMTMDVWSGTAVERGILLEPLEAADWREKILGLFGSITDETFHRPAELLFSSDAERAEL